MNVCGCVCVWVSECVNVYYELMHLDVYILFIFYANSVWHVNKWTVENGSQYIQIPLEMWIAAQHQSAFCFFFFSFIARSTYPFKITFVCVTSSSPVFERILCYIFMRLPLCFCKSSVNKLTHKVYLQFASNSMLVARFVFTKHFESIVPNADDEPLNH